MKVVGVNLKRTGKTYYFDPGDLSLQAGDRVVVSTTEGLDVGEVKYTDKEIRSKKTITSLKPVLRKVDQKDLKKIFQLSQKKPEALKIFRQKINFYRLPMKPVDVFFSFDGRTITFLFTAETRVDFRELVKDLARVFRKQIILRQIGPRDVAKIQGGYGICGRPLCCQLFLEDMGKVVMEMVKDQDLTFRSSEKLSGLCGRLKCCLAYEEEAYQILRKKMLELGTRVETKSGRGIIIGRNIIKQEVEVELDNQNKIMVPIKEVKILKR